MRAVGWLTAGLVVLALVTVTAVLADRSAPEVDLDLWCERAVAMVQANEDVLRADLLGGFEDALPELDLAFESARSAVLELDQPKELEGLIPYGQDREKVDAVFDFVAAECGYRFNVNNGRLPDS